MPWLRSSASEVQTNVFCCFLIVNYGVALHRTCHYTIVQGFFWVLLEALGIFLGLDFWLHSIIPSLEILSTPLGVQGGNQSTTKPSCTNIIIRKGQKILILNYLSSLCASSGFCPSFFISVNSSSKSITDIFTPGPALKENFNYNQMNLHDCWLS